MQIPSIIDFWRKSGILDVVGGEFFLQVLQKGQFLG
jgi:hypothetical protein